MGILTFFSKTKNSFLRLKNYFDNLKLYFSLPHPSVNGREVGFFDLCKPSNRYPYNLIKFFELASYNVLLKHRFSLINRLHDYGKLTFSTSHFRIKFLGSGKHTLFVSEQLMKCTTQQGSSIFVEYNCFFRQFEKNTTLSIPFTMHPAVYANESIYNEIPIYRQQVRQMKVAFLGNAQDESYKIGEQHIRNLFEKNVRPSLVDYLKTYLSEDEQ